MCWLKSLTFISMMALGVAQTTTAPSTPSPVAAPICGSPLALGPNAGVPQVPPIRPDQRRLPYLGSQYWPGYGANSWYGYRPYWGGYQQAIPRSWVPRLRSRPVVLPFEAAAVPVVGDAEAVADTAAVPSIEAS